MAVPITFVPPLQPWMDELNALMSNSSEAFIESILKDVIRDLCRRSHVWRDMIFDYTVFKDEGYLVFNPAQQDRKIIQVYQVFVDEKPLAQTTYALSRKTGSVNRYSALGDDPSAIHLDMVPDTTAENTVSALVAFEPVNFTECLPPVLGVQCYEAIRVGALGRVYNHKGRPYADSDMARLYMRAYRSEVAQARIRADLGFTPQAVAWQYPTFH